MACMRRVQTTNGPLLELLEFREHQHMLLTLLETEGLAHDCSLKSDLILVDNLGSLAQTDVMTNFRKVTLR
jgi:hypothetical protein